MINISNYFKINTCIFALLSLLLTGCVNNLTGDSYSREEARQAQNVQFGTVYQIQAVKIEGTQTGIGALAGGASAGIAASSIGGGKGSSIAAIAGGLAGGVLGNMAEERLTRKQGVEITVKLDNGNFLSSVQELDPKTPFSVGDRVKILGQGKTRRIVKN